MIYAGTWMWTHLLGLLSSWPDGKMNDWKRALGTFCPEGRTVFLVAAMKGTTPVRTINMHSICPRWDVRGTLVIPRPGFKTENSRSLNSVHHSKNTCVQARNQWTYCSVLLLHCCWHVTWVPRPFFISLASSVGRFYCHVSVFPTVTIP